jgi:hypothetical protein
MLFIKSDGRERVWGELPCAYLNLNLFEASALAIELAILVRESSTCDEESVKKAAAPAEHTAQPSPYRRGPDSRKAKVGERNRLINQAKGVGMTTDNEIFEFVRKEDVSLLFTNKSGQELISAKSMMLAYKRTRAPR